MPLAFSSLNHGTVAFGFFQIHSHMLLLQELFFFADDFCTAVERLADHGAADLPGWRIDSRAAVGDLHGAIAGRDLRGFIGATYERWPFPEAPQDFRQHTQGHRTRDAVTALMEPFGTPLEIPLAWDRAAATVDLGPYQFDGPGFSQLLAYVERGGYPRWTADEAPDYVKHMLAAVANLW